MYGEFRPITKLWIILKNLEMMNYASIASFFFGLITDKQYVFVKQDRVFFKSLLLAEICKLIAQNNQESKSILSNFSIFFSKKWSWVSHTYNKLPWNKVKLFKIVKNYQNDKMQHVKTGDMYLTISALKSDVAKGSIPRTLFF